MGLFKGSSTPQPDRETESGGGGEQGSDGDIAKAYRDIRVSLLRFAARYFRRPQEIEDVVQEAFVKVIEAGRVRDIDNPKAYLYKATRNLALNSLDKSAYKLTDTVGDLLPDSALLTTPTMEDAFESQQRFELFCSAVRELPVKCRRVYVMRRVYGYSQKEIAAEMNISIKTVEAHLTKAIVQCTDYMDDIENPGASDPLAAGNNDQSAVKSAADSQRQGNDYGGSRHG